MARGKIEKRGVRRRRVKPVILIVTEGAQTEPKYFAQFRTRKTNIDIHVVGSRATGGGTDYVSLVRRAADYMEREQLSPEHGDSFWVVADGDVNFQNPSPVAAKDAQLARARDMAHKSNIQIVISNPCFEFWYLLHFRYTTGHLRDYDAVLAALRACIQDYEKNADVAERLAPHLGDAIGNAARVAAYHVSNGEKQPFPLTVNPFTDVYQLVEHLK